MHTGSSRQGQTGRDRQEGRADMYRGGGKRQTAREQLLSTEQRNEGSREQAKGSWYMHTGGSR